MSDAISQAIDCARNGNFIEARKLAEDYLTQCADDAQTWHLLGYLDEMSGSTDQAIQRYQKATELNPGIADYYSDLGLVLFKVNRLSDAENSLRNALELDPKHHHAAYNLALLLNRRNRFTEALSVLFPFDNCNDPSGETDLLLGILYRSLFRNQVALIHAKRSANLNPENAEAWALLADLHEHLNQLTEAENCLNEGLARVPNLPSLLLIKARLLRREKKFKEVTDTISMIQMDRVPDSLAANLLNECGTSLDRLNHPREAMEKFVAAKYRQSLSQPDISELASAYLGFIKEALTLDYNTLARQGMPSDEPDPVFLIGFPRSGTTLLDQILDSHSSIQTLEEKPLIANLVDSNHELFKAVDNRVLPLQANDRHKLQALYFKHAAQYVKTAPDKVWIDRNPHNLALVHQILQIFPRARFILALRHPCDVVLSCQMHLFNQNPAMEHCLTLEGTARLYATVMQLWQTFKEKLHPKHHVIRYENLVTQFDEELDDLLDFLNLPWEENVRKYNEHAKNRGFINTPSYLQVVEPLYTRASGRWMRYKNELAPVLPILEPAIHSLGYDLPPD